MDVDREKLLGQIWSSDDLGRTFNALCSMGGRLCGSDAEDKAREFLVSELKKIGANVSAHTCHYSGWKREKTRLQIQDGNEFVDVATTSMLQSPDTPIGGMELEVIDLGRGSVEEFEALKDSIPGKAVLVRHEYFFTVAHVPRRRKYALSKQYGAKAFLVANYLPGAGIVNGVAGRGQADDIPSAGMSYESGEWLSQLCRKGRGKVKLEIKASRNPATSENIIGEIPGSTDEWVVVCAHYDGQHLGQSAMDNGSGTAAALEAFRHLAGHARGFRRGLRLILFTLEHWGLLGSSLYVKDQKSADLDKISLVINLDTVGGGRRLSALTSGLDDVSNFVREATNRGGVPLDIVNALQINSDHYNFYLAGVPSLRLIAGHEDPEADCKYMMAAADTRDKVEPGQLIAATMVTAQIALAACTAKTVAKRRNPDQINIGLDKTDPWVSDRVNAK
jgi:hypothetical protein